jgi:prolyl-tRNA synthetase
VTKDQLIAYMDGDAGFAYGGFCGDGACEQAIKERTKATVRVLPDPEFRSPEAPTACVWCGKAAVAEAVWAKAY